jgi:hypothetical protein
MRPIRSWLFGIYLGVATPVAAQTVTSAVPESVSVTIYRSPERSADDAINLNWLRGYALVTEQRRVTIPAGTATLRFEGVAGGILAESAIVTGLPSGVSEKNLDADLLSPRSLYDRSLNRPVTIRRTDRATGRVTEEPAVIRSAAEGAMVVQTRSGIEALQCSGLPEALVYDGVPSGLSAKPTLSVQTTSPQAYQATVTLSYLAWGFDWQANYVVEMAEGGRSARLFAWVTLANGDVTSFPDARTSVVAGKVNRESDADDQEDAPDPELYVRCVAEEAPPPPPPPPPPAPMMMMEAGVAADEIIVTGSRLRRAVQEDLGDLKLYRVPFATTVAANAQKQVAMIDKAGVPVGVIYATTVEGGGKSPTMTTLTARNRTTDGLGLPLPAGPVAAFEPGGRGLLLIGEGSLEDKAIGEDVEIEIAEATQVTVENQEAESGDTGDRHSHVITVRNANPWPIAHRLRIAKNDDQRVRKASARLVQEDGFTVWRTTIPANGERSLRYRIETPG